MDQKSESGALGSRGRKKRPGTFSDRRNPGLFDPNAASPSSNHHRYLPEVTRQMLLDTSDSESDRFESAECKSGDGSGHDRSKFPQKPRISSHELEPPPAGHSPVRSSRGESVQFGSNLICESSSSNICGPNRRFVVSPHPDMIQPVSKSRSLKSESSSDSSSSWKNAEPSQYAKPLTVGSKSESCEKFVASSLPKPRFSFKPSSSVSLDPEKHLRSGPVNAISEIEGNLDCNMQMVSRQWITAPSVPVIIGHANSGRFENETGPGQSSSYSNVEAVCTATLNFRGVSSNRNPARQQAFPSRAVSAPSEPVISKRNYGLSGRRDFEVVEGINATSSSQIASQSIQLYNSNDARVASVSSGKQKTVSDRATYVKLGPAEFDPRSAVCSQDRSNMSQNRPSFQMPESGQVPSGLSFTDVGPIGGSMQCLNNQQTILHQTSSFRPKQVGFDCLVPCGSESGYTNARNIPSSSSKYPMTLGACHTSSSGHSNESYMNVGSGNKDSSGSPGNVPSKQSCINTKANSDSSSQERRISSESSDPGDVVMSLVYKKNKIAGSSYNSSTGQVNLLESVSENFEFSTTVLALRSVLPSVVVLPSSGATRFVKELKAKIEGDQTLKDCQFQCLSPRYFAYGFARRTVLESSLWEGCLTFRSEDSKKNFIVSNINLNDERLVCAFGGLLYHLSTGCPQLGAGMLPPPITSVQHVKLSNKLWLDTASFKNLQIFDPVEHPSSFIWSSTNKDEGKSIFGLFERFCSPVGMTKLKSFLANPVNCRRILEKRHEVMNFYLNHSNFSAVEALKSFASQMSTSSLVVSYLSSPTLRGGHWKHIYRHIYYTVSYAEVCRSHGDQSELFRELGSTIVDAVYSMAHYLERVVDLVNMENNETFVIKYGFHPPLDAAKKKFSRLKMAMDKVTPYEFDSVPAFITRIQMMYIPEMKFLLSIPYWSPDLSKEELNLPNLEFRFAANRTAFYKSRRCYELDELLGDAQTDIINEESMIIQSLRKYLKKHMHHIVGMAQNIAEIECIFALAKVAKEERYTKPEIVDSCIIDIRGGWHPLLDVPSNEVITNDMISSADTNLVKLIYGPNASGKSMYLKLVGLIMYLVHLGSYVPAISVRVGLFCRILVRTVMEESVVSMSSTMLSELKKLQDSVMGCAKDSLVILDEVGEGSNEVNCIAIVTSAINYFLSQGSDCPHVLISTHLSGISDFVTSPPHSDEGRNLFELLTMDYAVAEGEIVFLYKIRRGGTDGGFVFEVLENSEFAAPIVKTARTVLEALRTGENLLPCCETRIQRSHKYLNFIRKFVNIDIAKPGYLEKLQNKIQRYCEKHSY